MSLISVKRTVHIQGSTGMLFSDSLSDTEAIQKHNIVD